MEYIAAKQHGPAANYPIRRIVMHGTVSPCVPGGARAIAGMFHNTTRDASAQYVVDPTAVIQCVRDNVVAYGAPPNPGSIHVEQCDPQTGSSGRWRDANHQAMLRLAARLVAALCRKYDIPAVKLSAADLRAGRKGICGHADVSAAWHQTDHVDPGPDYPWSQFLALVNAALHPPTPTPIPTAMEDDDMQVLVREEGVGTPVYLGNYQTRRKVGDVAELDQLVHCFQASGANAWVATVHSVPVGTLDYYGVDTTPTGA